MGGLVMGNSADVPAHIAAINRPTDGVIRVVGLDGENVGAGGEPQAATDAAMGTPLITDIPVELITTPDDSPSA